MHDPPSRPYPAQGCRDRRVGASKPLTPQPRCAHQRFAQRALLDIHLLWSWPLMTERPVAKNITRVTPYLCLWWVKYNGLPKASLTIRSARIPANKKQLQFPRLSTQRLMTISLLQILAAAARAHNEPIPSDSPERTLNLAVAPSRRKGPHIQGGAPTQLQPALAPLPTAQVSAPVGFWSSSNPGDFPFESGWIKLRSGRWRPTSPLSSSSRPSDGYSGRP